MALRWCRLRQKHKRLSAKLLRPTTATTRTRRMRAIRTNGDKERIIPHVAQDRIWKGNGVTHYYTTDLRRRRHIRLMADKFTTLGQTSVLAHSTINHITPHQINVNLPPKLDGQRSVIRYVGNPLAADCKDVSVDADDSTSTSGGKSFPKLEQRGATETEQWHWRRGQQHKSSLRA